MNFFKKISPKVVAFLIIVYLSFTFTGCPSTSSTKLETDKALIDFYSTYNTYTELHDRERIFVDLLAKNTDKYVAITADLSEPTLKEKEQIEKLSKEALDILTEGKEVLDAIGEIRHNQRNIISELQENATKIEDPSKKLLAQEIADKLREINNLEIEEFKLFIKGDEYNHLLFENFLSSLQGKMTVGELLKEAGEIYEEVEEILKGINEIDNAIEPLREELSDLKEKFESLITSK